MLSEMRIGMKRRENMLPMNRKKSILKTAKVKHVRGNDKSK